MSDDKTNYVPETNAHGSYKKKGSKNLFALNASPGRPGKPGTVDRAESQRFTEPLELHCFSSNSGDNLVEILGERLGR